MTIEVAIESAGIDNPTIIGEAAEIVSKKTDKEIQLYLFGDAKVLNQYASERVNIINAPYFPDKREREQLKKKNLGSSLEKTLEFAKTRNIPALCLASTSATKYVIDREKYVLDGVYKPTIAIEIPTKEGFNILADAGLNPHLTHHDIILPAYSVSPNDLAEFGVMAACYSQAKGNEPLIGLLSFNEEFAPEIVKKAKKILNKKSTSNNFKTYDKFFRGINIYQGNGRVFVCEGNMGNILLTAIESFSETMDNKNPKFDQDNYGAMPILGTYPNIMIGHRHTGLNKAISAIERSIDFFEIKDKVNELIIEKIYP